MIELRGISKVYNAGSHELRALDNVNLTIGDGEFVAIIGASGSGKSTLMNLLGCLDTATTGSYVLNGTVMEHLTEHELAAIRNQAIGFVFQSFNLLPRMQAIRQVEMPLIYRGVQDRTVLAAHALEAVGLGDRLDAKPNQLSGGEQQRVAIARALITAPSLLLADEPTGNLDSRTSLEIIGMFQKPNRDAGITVIYVTHEPDIADHAKRVIRMRDGRVVSDERKAQPLNAEEELRALNNGPRALAEATV